MFQWVTPSGASTPGANTTHEYWDHSHPTFVVVPVLFYIVTVVDATIGLFTFMKWETGSLSGKWLASILSLLLTLSLIIIAPVIIFCGPWM